MSSFVVPFFVLSDVAKIDTFASGLISFYIYFLDVKSQTDTDYLSERIKKLEEKK